MDYRKALSPDQIPKMTLFLQTLTRDADTIRDNGQRIDVARYIQEWRGYKSSWEKRAKERRRYREGKECTKL